MEMDSLKSRLRAQDRFIGNVQTILKGDVPKGETYREPDQVKTDDLNKEMNPQVMNAGDSIIRQEFEQQDFSLTSYSSNNYSEELKDIFFFPSFTRDCKLSL